MFNTNAKRCRFKLFMFTSRVRLLVLLIVGIALGFSVQRVALRSADMFFLDWRQILANGDAPKIPVKLVDVSKLKNAIGSNEADDGGKINQRKLVELVRKIAEQNPTIILLDVSRQEINIEKESPEWMDLISIPKFSLFVNNAGIAEKDSLSYHSTLKDFPRKELFQYTWDSRIDGVSRRNIIFYDLDHKIPSDNFTFLERFTGQKVSPESFDKNFEHIETLQVYLKLWPNENFDLITVSEDGKIDSNFESFKNQMVILHTTDIFSMLHVPSILSRTTFFSGAGLHENYWTEARLIANYIANMLHLDYIKQPSYLTDSLWISFWLLLLLWSAFYLDPKRALLMGFVWPVIFIVVALIVFRLTSYHLDMSRVMIANFLLQYTVAPIRLMQSLRRQDRLEVERTAELSAERAKNKFLVKAASSDMQMRIVAQVSHDIRSPLMALQIAHKVIKGSISEEAGELIHGAIERLKYIAADTLSQYRNEESGDVQVNLKESLDDLARTFQVLYPDVVFKIEIPAELNILWPPHSLARAFTNLFNNSIEAFGKKQGLVIRVSAEVFEDRNVIFIQDNGPGISQEILPKLFQAGGTFGKASGTGLGLYQVRKDLADFGGRVQALASVQGALFEVVLPRYLDKLEVKVSKKLLVVANSELPLSYEPEIQVVRVQTLQEAKKLILLEEDISAVTLIMDLVFPNEEETGFDLIESMGSFRPYKIFVCTSLGENDEIRKLSDRYDVLLVTRAMMSRFSLKA